MINIGIFKNIAQWVNGSSQEPKWEIINASTGEGYIPNIVSNSPEITYYICLKVLSESVGKLSIHLKDGAGNKIYGSDINKLLRIRPNSYMSPTDFKTLMEYNRNHFGNAYALIETAKGKRVGLHPLDPLRVKIIVDDANELKHDAPYVYKYTSKSNEDYYFDYREIIHLKGGLSKNGIVGKSVAEELADTIEGSKEAQAYLNDLYKRGLSANAILQYTGDLSEKSKREMLSKLKKFAKSNDYGNIIPIPLGMELKPLDIKLSDAQFYELKKFNSLQIAAAFGIKPNHLNDYSKSSYANSESQNLAFLVDTLLYILAKWEEELDYKLLFEKEIEDGYHTKFNLRNLLRGDIKTQSEALQKFVTTGVYSINDARTYLGEPVIEGGDVYMVNGTYVKLEEIGKAYSKNSEERGDSGDDQGSQ